MGPDGPTRLKLRAYRLRGVRPRLPPRRASAPHGAVRSIPPSVDAGPRSLVRVASSSHPTSPSPRSPVLTDATPTRTISRRWRGTSRQRRARRSSSCSAPHLSTVRRLVLSVGGPRRLWRASHGPLHPADAGRRHDRPTQLRGRVAGRPAQIDAARRGGSAKVLPVPRSGERYVLLRASRITHLAEHVVAGRPGRFLKTEVDCYCTYVGAPRAVVDDLLAATAVEAIEVTLDNHLDAGGYRPRWR
jgi:hypothetical protein